MAGNDLAMRFTEDKYATKNEVARELKITSVDTFWANILAYRSNFYHYLTVRTIEKKMLLVAPQQSRLSSFSSCLLFAFLGVSSYEKYHHHSTLPRHLF